jgi:hypothetical protein
LSKVGLSGFAVSSQGITREEQVLTVGLTAYVSGRVDSKILIMVVLHPARSEDILVVLIRRIDDDEND